MNKQNEVQSKAQRIQLHFRSPLEFALSVAACHLLFFNLRFWQEMGAQVWQYRMEDGLFLLCTALLLLAWYTSALLMLPGKNPPRLVAGLLFPLASMAAFCADNYGVAIDKNMFRNISQTDSQEVQGLLSLRLVFYTALFGVLPVFLVARSHIASTGPGHRLRQGISAWGATLALTALTAWAFSDRLQELRRERPQLRYLLVPASGVDGAIAYLHGEALALHSSAQATKTAPKRLSSSAGDKPLLVFAVIGETARHQNFQLGGYARATNPALSRLDNVYYFGNTVTCATSTALAVPCMLSRFRRSEFDPALAERTPNVIDELVQAGVQISWRSNNFGSEAAGAGVDAVRFDERTAPSFCNTSGCLDEVLLQGLEQELEQLSTDALVVFHQMGSHGPAYYQRYPSSSEVFQPACKTNDFTHCTREELLNAYDNTIAYTDRILAAKIALLSGVSHRFDTALIYVSDHGESLGENGIYLHSSPYDIAPEEQKRVPLLLWLSSGLQRRLELDTACLRGLQAKPASHDNMYHTLLGLLRTRTQFYDSGMDLLALCSAVQR